MALLIAAKIERQKIETRKQTKKKAMRENKKREGSFDGDYHAFLISNNAPVPPRR
jgi:hypothetical protein